MLIEGEITIFNMMGEALLQKKLDAGHQPIDVTNLKAGFYYLQVGSARKMFSKI
jgi:hypothetical protein